MKQKKIKIRRLCIVCSSICLFFALSYHYLHVSIKTISSSSKTTDFSSKQALLTKLDSNTIYFQKNSEDIIAPASLTKIMSAIIVIEHYDDYDTKVKIMGEDLRYLSLQNSSLAGFSEDESVSVMDLLYGTMLSSGGEATIALAKSVAGSEKQFVAMMNEKAKELSLTNTHYDNSCGFDSPNHYSSVKDITKVLRYSLQNPLFKKIFTTPSYTTSPTVQHPKGITLYSTMFTNMDNFNIDNTYIQGGKTGYTGNAGLCLASLGVINKQEYIFVSTGASGNRASYPHHINDALLAYGNFIP